MAEVFNPDSRTAAARYRTAKLKDGVKSGRRWLMAIAILQLVFGVFFGLSGQKDVAAAEKNLAQYADTEEVETGGQTWVVGELRAQIRREQVAMFVVPIGLGVAFLGLWFWARRAPVAAMVVALGLFVTVHAIDAVLEPENLAKGILVKVLFVAGMIAGIKAAVAARELPAEPAAPTAV